MSDYFDRLALDRAIDSIATAHRNLTAEVAATGAAGVPGWRPGASSAART